jgi:hypothetical protein
MDPGLLLRLIERADGDVVVAIGRSPRGLALTTEDGTDAVWSSPSAGRCRLERPLRCEP